MLGPHKLGQELGLGKQGPQPEQERRLGQELGPHKLGPEQERRLEQELERRKLGQEQEHRKKGMVHRKMEKVYESEPRRLLMVLRTTWKEPHKIAMEHRRTL